MDILFQLLWKRMSALEIPQKTKVFLWKAISGWIPTAENLARKQLISSACYHRCKSAVETLNHTFFLCKETKQSSRLSGLGQLIDMAKNGSFEDVVFHCCSSLSDEELRKVVVQLRVIWGARNSSLFQGQAVNCDLLAAKVEAHCSNFFQQKQNYMNHELPRDKLKDTSWTPPAGIIKINVDASTNAEERAAAYGVVCKDSEGKVVAVASKCAGFHGDVERAEAEALFFGVPCAKSVGFIDIIVESDSKNIIDLVKGKLDRYHC